MFVELRGLLRLECTDPVDDVGRRLCRQETIYCFRMLTCMQVCINSHNPLFTAGKHWNGLLKGWYAERISRLMKAGLAAAAQNKPLTKTAINQLENALASEFTTDFQVSFAEEPSSDPVSISQRMLAKYRSKFDSCGAPDAH